MASWHPLKIVAPELTLPPASIPVVVTPKTASPVAAPLKAVREKRRDGPVQSAWALMIVAMILPGVKSWLLVFSVIFYLAALVLGIVVLVKQRIVAGVIILIFSLLVGPLFSIGMLFAKQQESGRADERADVEKRQVAEHATQEQASKHRQEVIDAAIAKRRVIVGMSSGEARQAWGEPQSINRTVSGRSVHEQWVYGIGSYLYIEDGRLTSYQTSR